MERTPPQSAEEQASLADVQPGESIAAAESELDESWDERVIREGIEAARAEGRPIDDRTARYIASQLHGGQASALYTLASSGAIRPEVFDELDRDRVEQPTLVRGWLACLTVYCAVRGESGPIEGWAEQSEEQDRTDLMARIAGGGARTLGELAVIRT